MDMNKLALKYKKAEDLAKRLGATRTWISMPDFFAEFGETIGKGRIEVRADIKYGGMYVTEVSGASYHLGNKKDMNSMIKRLQNAIKVYDALK